MWSFNQEIKELDANMIIERKIIDKTIGDIEDELKEIRVKLNDLRMVMAKLEMK